MSLHHIANHLASKGRNGDTTLVHMTKGEVAGLQALAKRNGTSLTVNPHTGLPEAFGLKQLLPMAAGAALVASGVGAPLAAGIVGAGTWAATGSLQQGLMAGLGAYGGAGLAGMAGAGAAAGTQAAAGEVAAQQAAEQAAAEQVATQAAEQQAAQQMAQQTAATSSGISGSGIGAADVIPQQVVDPYSVGNVNYGYTGSTQGLNQAGLSQGMSSMGGAQGATMPAYGGTVSSEGVTSLGANAQPIGGSLGTSTAATGAPETAGQMFMRRASDNPMQAAQYGMAAASPLMADAMKPKQYAQPEIKSDADMGQRYAFESGYDNTIPGRTGPASYRQISNEEAKKLYGFAEGGDVQYPAGEAVIRMAEGGSAGYTGNVGDYTAADAAAARGGYGLGIDYSGYDTPVAPMAGVAALPAARAVSSSVKTPEKGLVYDPVSRTYVGGGTDADYLGGGQYGKTQAEKDAEAATAAITAEPVYYAQGGISTLGGYSDGGRLLKGPGDGMSDNIPAQIGSKQPARLADGEFVVPADVVSHLGNGSTDAGAKQLYKMMDKVRAARTGRKAQGKQINPNKYVPA